MPRVQVVQGGFDVAEVGGAKATASVQVHRDQSGAVHDAANSADQDKFNAVFLESSEEGLVVLRHFKFPWSGRPRPQAGS